MYLFVYNTFTFFRFVCDVCGLRFKRTSNYHGHMKSHQEKKFQCHLCGNYFLRKRYLAVHQQTIHDYYGEGVKPQEKGFQCEVRTYVKYDGGFVEQHRRRTILSRRSAKLNTHSPKANQIY